MARRMDNPEQRVPASAALHVSRDSSDPQYETWTFVIYDVARLPDVQSSWIATGTLIRGARGFVATIMAARPGFGPLLYTLAATYTGVPVFPSDERSEDALRFWRRQPGECVYPLTDAGFDSRFGKAIGRMKRDNRATKAQIAEMVDIGGRKSFGQDAEEKQNPSRGTFEPIPVVCAITTLPGGRLAYVFAETPTRKNPDLPDKRGRGRPEIPALPAELEKMKIDILLPLSEAKPKHSALYPYRMRADYRDLASEAYIGILEAANKYARELAEGGKSPETKEAFTSRLNSAARSAINKYLAQNSGIVQQGRKARQERKYYFELKQQTAQRLRIPIERVTVQEIADANQMTVDAVQDLRTAAESGGSVSLDVPISSDAEGNEQLLSDVLPDVDEEARGEAKTKREDIQRIKLAAGASLNGIEQEFLEWKIKDYTVVQIAAKLGMGRTTAYATYRRILPKLNALKEQAEAETRAKERG